MRDQLLSALGGLEPWTIAIEACTGAFCWARKVEELGHRVKIVSPQYVKPFVRGQTNDSNDAEAICTAVRQPHSSGDKRSMLSISERGSQHLRTLLVHGARAVVRTAPNKTDQLNAWVNDLRERRGTNRATVAVANKNARVIWAVLRSGEPYRAAA
ncbi:MAG: transposase [Devosia sp.]